MRYESTLAGARRRLLALIALYGPGAETTRVRLHRMRGVKIGEGCFIGTDVIIETAFPHLVEIGDRVDLGLRTTIVAHQQGEVADESKPSVKIGDDVFIGPGSLLLPHVSVGDGAVVTAGSVVTTSVPPLTMVRGNPAEPVARCGVPLGRSTPMRQFYRQLRPIRRK
ncbi:MAG TPA: acyltransferase [Solirubrobacterales bacterium]|nr:acyltransferase [Solirubrobacterales bacterium]